MDPEMRRRDMESFYRRYNQVCNDHDFGSLGDFVHAKIIVNGSAQSLNDYIAGLRAVTDAFPDYRWKIQHLLIEGSWISAHFQDTGTQEGAYLGVQPSGRAVSTQEFSLYRIEDHKIAEVWVTADNLRLMKEALGQTE